ncbi:hypothetical protein IQ243_01350 [Nostocales cyanobacterium LEGE 11386]|nr:hypothetical protein [Nostocales cyanobacterium LEGE 11386]
MKKVCKIAQFTGAKPPRRGGKSSENVTSLNGSCLKSGNPPTALPPNVNDFQFPNAQLCQLITVEHLKSDWRYKTAK